MGKWAKIKARKKKGKLYENQTKVRHGQKNGLAFLPLPLFGKFFYPTLQPQRLLGKSLLLLVSRCIIIVVVVITILLFVTSVSSTSPWTAWGELLLLISRGWEYCKKRWASEERNLRRVLWIVHALVSQAELYEYDTEWQQIEMFAASSRSLFILTKGRQWVTCP